MKKQQILNKTTNRREYKWILTFDDDPYGDKDRFKIHTARRGRAGYWTRKGIFPHKARECRTWKYNRKTKYKC